MKKKAGQKQIDRCTPIFDEWLYKLGLKWWEIKITYYRKEKQFKKDNGVDVAIMRCWVKWEYFTFNVDVNLSSVRCMDDDDLEYAIVHELCHAMVNEMNEDDPDGKHEERTVTMLTKAFIWVRDLTLTPDKMHEDARCYDCGLLYGSPAWIELVIPNDIWAKITPSIHKEGGLLCPTCMAKRCADLGLENISAQIFSGPFEIKHIETEVIKEKKE